jgi:hypothetical protein
MVPTFAWKQNHTPAEEKTKGGNIRKQRNTENTWINERYINGKNRKMK